MTIHLSGSEFIGEEGIASFFWEKNLNLRARRHTKEEMGESEGVEGKHERF